MHTRFKRIGLSFEVAPPAATHPNRTDVACFVGAVARRRATAPTKQATSVRFGCVAAGGATSKLRPIRLNRVCMISGAWGSAAGETGGEAPTYSTM